MWRLNSAATCPRKTTPCNRPPARAANSPAAYGSAHAPAPVPEERRALEEQHVIPLAQDSSGSG
eukprot:CAMPEP_0115737592 /NCGR_PEP_ID=MMETSP0272-20121206/87900_1 /TAXON_ID=71861 /ORGANISM="Scrippsiella trochoidea, Strain CCMP3099" /LENGTH=63 /DNA_ID=CAMNT_0003181905 /DNA_START=12 /DNA_END=200 /DNA_ORIENTATION=+